MPSGPGAVSRHFFRALEMRRVVGGSGIGPVSSEHQRFAKSLCASVRGSFLLKVLDQCSARTEGSCLREEEPAAAAMGLAMMRLSLVFQMRLILEISLILFFEFLPSSLFAISSK